MAAIDSCLEVSPDYGACQRAFPGFYGDGGVDPYDDCVRACHDANFGANLECVAQSAQACRAVVADGGVPIAVTQACNASSGTPEPTCDQNCQNALTRCMQACPTSTPRTCADCNIACSEQYHSCSTACPRA
jgi:hypothetical protein